MFLHCYKLNIKVQLKTKQKLFLQIIIENKLGEFPAKTILNGTAQIPAPDSAVANPIPPLQFPNQSRPRFSNFCFSGCPNSMDISISNLVRRC